MALEYLEEEAIELRNDYDLLRLGRSLNRKLKLSDSIVSLVHSHVAKVGEGFSIDSKLRIKVASYRLLTKLGMKPEEFPEVYKGALLHENGHALLFPFITRYNTVLAIVHRYLKERGIPYDDRLLHAIENDISDAYNELILYRFKRTWYEYIPALCDKYVIRPQKDKIAELLKKDRPRLEARPNRALILLHNLVFSLLYNGKLKAPRIPKPRWLSDYVYNQLYKTSKSFPLEEHIEVVNTGHFNTWINIILKDGLFENIDQFYDALYTIIGDYKGELKSSELRNRVINHLSYENEYLAPYWVYFTLLAAYYRFVKDLQPPPLPIKLRLNVDTGEDRPESPSGDVLDAIYYVILYSRGGEAPLVPPALAEYAAKRLLSETLAVAGKEVVYETEATTIKVPWYRRPRGKIDPYSMLKPSILDWRVQVKHRRYTGRKIEVARTAKLPSHITVVIDESSSTLDTVNVLSHIVGADTTRYDVERITLMSLLWNAMQYRGDVPVTLVRFATDVTVERGTIREVYERLKNMRGSDMLGGMTAIEAAVDTALRLHRDGPSNYFLLATDMEIEEEQARMILDMLSSKLRRSPILILAVASSAGILEDLNTRRNAAVVSVRTQADYRALEEAIRKLARVLGA